METKYCKFCDTSKPLNKFIKNKKCSLGVNNKCKDCIKEYRQKYNKQNKEKILEYNTEFNKTYNKKWNNKNKSIVKWRNLLHRCLIYQGKYKNTKTQILLKYTHQQFKDHIFSQFTEGMNWDNIAIDHKVPLTWFHEDTPPHIVNDLRNLQPLYTPHNISKSNTYADKVEKNYWDLIQKYLINPTTVQYYVL